MIEVRDEVACARFQRVAWEWLQSDEIQNIRLRACFVGEPAAERFAHRRFCNLRIRNELFVAHPIIDEYFASSRRQMRELNARLDLRMLGPWLTR